MTKEYGLDERDKFPRDRGISDASAASIEALGAELELNDDPAFLAGDVNHIALLDESSKKDPNLELVKDLLKSGADPYFIPRTDSVEECAMWHFLYNGNIEALELLADNNVSFKGDLCLGMKAVNPINNNPQELLKSQGHHDALKMLEEKGVFKKDFRESVMEGRERPSGMRL